MGEDRRLTEERYHEELERRLNELRPARYHEDDTSWMEPVIEWAAANMPPAMREHAQKALPPAPQAQPPIGDRDG